MKELISLLGAVSPPFLLLFIGGVSRWRNWLAIGVDRQLSRLIVTLLYPCFIIYHILGAENPVGLKESTIAAIFGFFSISVGFLIARFVSYSCKIKEGEKPAFCFCSGIFNYGFFAIPVASVIFGNDLVVKIVLFNLGVEVAIWTVGILVLTSSAFDWKKILNPPAISVILGLFLQALGGKEIFPLFLWETLSMIAYCSIPIALLAIGAGFYDLLTGYRPSSKFRVEIGAVLTRGILVPLIFISYAWYGWIPEPVNWMPEVLIVQAAMPAGVFALIIVNNYGEDSTTGLRAILATAVVSLLTMPAWLFLGLQILGR